MTDYACLLPFDSDDETFARGFEAGRIWALLRERPSEPVTEPLHAENTEMILRMAEATGRSVASEELGGEWLVATFEPAQSLHSAT